MTPWEKTFQSSAARSRLPCRGVDKPMAMACRKALHAVFNSGCPSNSCRAYGFSALPAGNRNNNGNFNNAGNNANFWSASQNENNSNNAYNMNLNYNNENANMNNNNKNNGNSVRCLQDSN